MHNAVMMHVLNVFIFLYTFNYNAKIRKKIKPWNPKSFCIFAFDCFAIVIGKILILLLLLSLNLVFQANHNDVRQIISFDD